MNDKKTPSGFFDILWDLFASVKLTIVMLLSLAATSIIGTLIPQNEDPVAYFEAFGDFFYRFLSVLDIFDMYHSWWFQILIILLTANIIICSIDRISSTRKILFVRRPKFKPARFNHLKNKIEFADDRHPDELRNLYAPHLKKSFRYTQTQETETGFYLFGERGRWTRFGVYGVHLSVVLLLIGGLIGSIFGFDGFVHIPEGETVSQIRLPKQAQALQLGFEIRCDDYFESYYENGTPKEFRSSLTILEAGQPVLSKDIIVNDPLRYKGVSFYQSSRGQLPPNEVVLSFSSTKTGMVYTHKAVVGQKFVVPEKLGVFELKAFVGSAQFQGHDIGEAFVGALTAGDGKSIEITLPTRFPSFDKMRKGEVVIAVVEYVPRFYTGLQVVKDPGVWPVYFGFILMIMGCYVTFFMSHQQICVAVDRADNSSSICISGTANKNRIGMRNRIERIAHELKGLTQSD